MVSFGDISSGLSDAADTVTDTVSDAADTVSDTVSDTTDAVSGGGGGGGGSDYGDDDDDYYRPAPEPEPTAPDPVDPQSDIDAKIDELVSKDVKSVSGTSTSGQTSTTYEGTQGDVAEAVGPGEVQSTDTGSDGVDIGGVVDGAGNALTGAIDDFQSGADDIVSDASGG